METYFVNYNLETGEIIKLYIQSLDGENIPSDSIEMSKDAYDLCSANMGLYKINIVTLDLELIPIKYFMDYDRVTGEIVGFYTLAKHGDNIPLGSIEVTKEKRDEIISSNGTTWLNIDTLAYEIKEPLLEVFPNEKTEEQLKIATLLADNAQLKDTINFILVNY